MLNTPYGVGNSLGATPWLPSVVLPSITRDCLRAENRNARRPGPVFSLHGPANDVRKGIHARNAGRSEPYETSCFVESKLEEDRPARACPTGGRRAASDAAPGGSRFGSCGAGNRVRETCLRPCSAFLAALVAFLLGGIASAAQPPYRDASLPLARRVEDLLGRMTLEEKGGAR